MSRSYKARRSSVSKKINIDGSLNIMETSDGSYKLEMNDVVIRINDKKYWYNVLYVTEWRAVCVSVTIPCKDGSYRMLKIQKDDDQDQRQGDDGGYSNEAVHRLVGHLTLTPNDGSGDIELPVEVKLIARKQQKRPGLSTLVFRSLLSCFT